MSDLVVAIDASRDGKSMVIAVVGAREHLLKSEITRRSSWLQHFRRIPSNEKRRYLRKFPDRFSRIQGFLAVIRVTRSIDEADKIIANIKPSLVVVDDKLYDKINHPNKVKESSPKPKYLDVLILLADNLANYFRYVVNERPERLLRELSRFEKR